MNPPRRLLPAVNAAELIPSISAGLCAAEAAVNARVLEGKMSIPYGLWPVMITNERGALEQVLQRLDKTVAGRLQGAFNSLRGRLSRFVSDCAIYRGHPDYHAAPAAANAGSPETWALLGKCVSLEVGENELVVQGDFSAAGKALLAANGDLAPSPHWGLKRTGEKRDGLEICEPRALYSMGLVSRPNIAGAAINEHPAAHVQAAEQSRALAAIAADFAELEARLAAANEGAAARETTIAELTARVQTLAADLETARKQLAEAVSASEAATAAANSQRAAAAAELAGANQRAAALVSAVVEAAAGGGLILAADKDSWSGKLAADPAAANGLLSRDRNLKTGSTIAAERIRAANDTLGGVTAGSRFERIVRERMAATKEDWPTAWNVCKAAHHELYNLMPNGGKA